jgi:cysteine desulfurase / selenocysteine lyase
MSTVRDSLAGRSRTAGLTRMEVRRIRNDFPILSQKIHGKPLVYLDNAATSQKPRSVVEALTRFYLQDYSNIHRGVHLLSQRATAAYEESRATVQAFINASETREIIFTRGTTEAINLVTNSYGRGHVGEGDEILITAMEHHSNIVPWQMLCQEKRARLRVVPVTDEGELDLQEFERLLNSRTRLLAVVHVSNVLGTINPVREMTALAHARGVPVLIDGAQAAPHLRIDVQALDCDFYAFSSHKVYGPTGVGALYGKAALLERMPPYQGGGDMISSVTFEETKYNIIPYKFEAGTPNIAGVVGLAAAIDYINGIGLDRINAYEQQLLAYATERISSIPGVDIIGTARDKASVVSFTLRGAHPHDIGTIVDEYGIAIRTGHHCAQPLMERYGVPATARASLAVYNTREEIDALVDAIYRVKEVFD